MWQKTRSIICIKIIIDLIGIKNDITERLMADKHMVCIVKQFIWLSFLNLILYETRYNDGIDFKDNYHFFIFVFVSNNNINYYLIVNFSCLLSNYIFSDIFAFFAPLWSIDASIVFKRLLHNRQLNWPLNLFFIGQQISKLQNFKQFQNFKNFKIFLNF